MVLWPVPMRRQITKQWLSTDWGLYNTNIYKKNLPFVLCLNNKFVFGDFLIVNVGRCSNSNNTCQLIYLKCSISITRKNLIGNFRVYTNIQCITSFNLSEYSLHMLPTYSQTGAICAVVYSRMNKCWGHKAVPLEMQYYINSTRSKYSTDKFQ